MPRKQLKKQTTDKKTNTETSKQTKKQISKRTIKLTRDKMIRGKREENLQETNKEANASNKQINK